MLCDSLVQTSPLMATPSWSWRAASKPGKNINLTSKKLSQPLQGQCTNARQQAVSTHILYRPGLGSTEVFDPAHRSAPVFGRTPFAGADRAGFLPWAAKVSYPHR